MSQDAHKKFVELIDHFQYAMLVTRSGDELRSRPMVIEDYTDDGRIRFITRDDSGKLEELEENNDVNVAMQGESRFLSVSGLARISKDRSLLNKAWQGDAASWIGTDKNDPHVAVLEVIPTHAEYWDQSDSNAIEMLLDNARATLTGEEKSTKSVDEHGTVDLRGTPV